MLALLLRSDCQHALDKVQARLSELEFEYDKLIKDGESLVIYRLPPLPPTSSIR